MRRSDLAPWLVLLCAIALLGCPLRRRRVGQDGGAAVSSTSTAGAGSLSVADEAAQELQRATEALFDAYDTSPKDGFLTGREIVECGCAAYDTNHDRRISRAEFFAGQGVALGAPRPAARTPVNPAAPRNTPMPAAGGNAAVGRYACRSYDGTNSVIPGDVVLDANGGYSIDGKPEGRYTFDPASRRITWLSGFYHDGFGHATLSPSRFDMVSPGGATWQCERK